MRQSLWMIFLGLFLVACGQENLRSEDDLELGDTSYTLDFETDDSFETGDYAEASLMIEAGRYWIRQGGERTAYIWGQGGEAAQNLALDVRVEAQSDFENDLFGAMCRVDEEGAGYIFLISSDGFAAIARTDGRSLSFLVDWTEDSAIKTGENSLRAVCVDNYLALYVNDELVADVEDSTYTRAGEVGLMAGILVESRDNLDEVIVSFDDLTVTEARLKN